RCTGLDPPPVHHRARRPVTPVRFPGGDGVRRLHTLQVFTVTSKGISHYVVFADRQVFETNRAPGGSGALNGSGIVLLSGGREHRVLPRVRGGGG
ncbi:MAG TPA: hypothetical protein VHN80_00465, partial [Kineosporiaceae bacterium]|nr:hypothetical protein [Kineosporiaceae bacterium]